MGSKDLLPLKLEMTFIPGYRHETKGLPGRFTAPIFDSVAIEVLIFYPFSVNMDSNHDYKAVFGIEMTM